MKRCSILALALILGCTIFTGCRRGNGNMSTVPPVTQAATERPTMATSPSTQPTMPIVTEPATQDPTADTATESTENATGEDNSSSRGMGQMNR